MLRIFAPGDTDFTTNGDKILRPLKAKIHKEDNGDYYLEIESGLEYIDWIVAGNIIVSNTPQGDQAFRITNPQKTKTKITAKARHVFYDAENYLVPYCDIEGQDCDTALNMLNSSTEPQSPFSVSSDIEAEESYICERESLAASVWKMIEVYGGHLVRDNFSFSLEADIEQDSEVTIRYGKNIKDITCEENWDDVVTVLMPIGKDGLLIDDQNPYLTPTNPVSYPIPYTKAVQFTQDSIQEDQYKDGDGNTDEAAYQAALLADLKERGQKYVDENCIPKVNYTLKANAQISGIGDRILVTDERLGLNLETTVIKYDYDPIQERYIEIEFGNFAPTLSGLLNEITTNTANQIAVAANTIVGEIKTASKKMNHIVTAGLTQTQTATVNAFTRILFETSSRHGTKILTESGGIKIGSGVTDVLISGELSFTALTEGIKQLEIIRVRSGVESVLAYVSDNLKTSGSLSIPALMVGVQENDLIYLAYHTTTADTIGFSNRSTQLTVQAVL